MKKTFASLLFAFTGILTAPAQDTAGNDSTATTKIYSTNEVDADALFPLEKAGLMKYITSQIDKNNLKEAIAQKVKGRVLVLFVIDEKGEVKQAHIGKSLHPECDEEALRIVRTLPKWIPAQLDGKPVASKQGTPVFFNFADKAPKSPEKDVYGQVEKMPVFKDGGVKGILDFITMNMRYPAVAVQANIEGRVIVGLTVNADGTAQPATIIRSVFPLLDQEALRVINMLPQRWIPGEHKGKPVAVNLSIPIIFKIPDADQN